MEEAKARIKGVLCSSGALVTRFNGRDPSLLRGIFPMLHADGIEFMIYPSWDDRLDTVRETMRSMLKDGIFNIPVVHADKRIGELLSHGSESDIAEARRRFSLYFFARVAVSIRAHPSTKTPAKAKNCFFVIMCFILQIIYTNLKVPEPREG